MVKRAVGWLVLGLGALVAYAGLWLLEAIAAAQEYRERRRSRDGQT